MKKTLLSVLAKAAGCSLEGPDKEISNIVIDSRDANPGSMFVCVIGENTDGHKYVGGAYDLGCRAFLMSDAKAAAEILKHDDASVILAKDSVKALEDMAEWYLSQFNIIKVGVTGSVGKTSTRHFTAAVLAGKYNTIYTKKNLNTNLGNCLTAFDADDDTKAAVFEMGMDGSGQIEEICSFIKPDAAIISNIGISHLERLKSRDNIAKAKLEITKFLPCGAPLFFIEDDEYLNEKRIRSLADGDYNCIALQSENSEFKYEDVKQNGSKGISFNVVHRNENVSVSMPVLGLHNAQNALLAIALGNYYGVDLNTAAKALSEIKEYSGRLEAANIGGVTLIDDSYNASPISMLSAIESLCSIDAKRHICVFGAMNELGSEKESGHRKVGKAAADKNIDIVLLYGNNRELYKEGVLSSNNKIEIAEFDDLLKLKEYVLSLLKSGDAVLVKGSNATKVSEVAKAIKEDYVH